MKRHGERRKGGHVPSVGRTEARTTPFGSTLHARVKVTIDDVRALTAGLPRSYEAVVRGRVKFRVGRIVYLSFSRDETLMGFALPKEEREAALDVPGQVPAPRPSDMRYQWLVVRLE